ncbi:MAG: helix-turn-helix domain-containing protein [Candidatus Zixiibacteriota bacterium]
MADDRTQYRYEPDTVTAPGSSLLEMLEYAGMTQTDLARRTGRPIKTINEIIHGKTAITPETALQFEKVLGVAASFWNNRERHYREFLARRLELEELKGMTEWVKRFPLKKMIEYKWISPVDSIEEKARALLQFFGIASPDQYEEVHQAGVAFRRSHKVRSDADAVAAWLHQGVRAAQSTRCAAFNAVAFKSALGQVRALTARSPEEFEPTLKQICAECGVAVALVRELPGAPVNGAARWLTKDKALLQLSLRYKTDDIFWFSFFHEAAHILLHSKREPFVDFENADMKMTDEEREANAFAERNLIPGEEYDSLISEPDISRASVVSFARRLGIAPGIVVGRLQHEGYIPRSRLNDLKVKLQWRETE